MNFVLFWSFIASLARFCVKKTFSAAPFVNVMGVLGDGRLFNLSRQRKIDAWPAAVLVVDEQNNIPETGPTHSPEYPLNFPPFARRNHLVAPIGTTSIAQAARIKSRHLTRSTHGTPELPVKFAEEDVAPHLHEPECWRTRRGARGERVSTGKALVPQKACRWTNRSRAPLSLTRNYL